MEIVIQAKAYKTMLEINSEQRKKLEECARVSRDAYNWGLIRYIEEYKQWYSEFKNRDQTSSEKKYPPKMDARLKKKKEFNNTVRKNHPRYVSNDYVPRSITQEAFEDLDKAYDRFVEAKKNGDVEKKIKELETGRKQESYRRKMARMRDRGYVGDLLKPFFPNLKSRFDKRKSFRIVDYGKRKNGLNGFRVTRDSINLGSLGWFRLAEKDYIPTGTTICVLSLSTENGVDWYVSAQVKESKKPQNANKELKLGIDVGINPLIQCSNGLRFDNPRALKKYEEKKARLQRELNRRTVKDTGGKNVYPQSAGYYETLAKLKDVELKIRNIRRNSTHTATKIIVDGAEGTIKIEDLNVAGMMKNSHLSKSIADSNMSEIHRQLDYKSRWKGKDVFLIDRFSPSSKTCNNCGCVNKKLKQGDKLWTCPSCGKVLDRDFNAANNIRDM